MPDREKVIKGLECCTSEQACKGCPYSQSETGHLCSFNCLHDALAMLKEQEGIIKTLEDKNTKLMLLINEYLKKEREAEAVVRCKDCSNWIPGYITDDDDFIPPKCGKYQQMVGHSADDYCSLAERE